MVVSDGLVVTWRRNSGGKKQNKKRLLNCWNMWYKCEYSRICSWLGSDCVTAPVGRVRNLSDCLVQSDEIANYLGASNWPSPPPRKLHRQRRLAQQNLAGLENESHGLNIGLQYISVHLSIAGLYEFRTAYHAHTNRFHRCWHQGLQHCSKHINSFSAQEHFTASTFY